MNTNDRHEAPELAGLENLSATDDNAPAWELIDPVAGRYMPRRVRGSCRGRELG